MKIKDVLTDYDTGTIVTDGEMITSVFTVRSMNMDGILCGQSVILRGEFAHLYLP